ncbi:MAG: HD domain-containing protein [Chlamydiae bacterium]|nr:HD domain-containing protein [Chlamydiota bacterium]
MFYPLMLAIFLPLFIFARQIETFYGPVEVEEQVLLELIDCPAFIRLKDVRQYGVSYYTSYNEEFNRYDHSIGVFALLRKQNLSLEEQIAGLLHDVSHTVFSHVGDWIFKQQHEDQDYQGSIHDKFLEKSGIASILSKHGISVHEVMPKHHLFPALECPLPDLCADRIDYNIQGAFHQGFITQEEAIEIFHSLQFLENHWISTRADLMKKLMDFSLYMTKNCWGDPVCHFASTWLANALLKALEIGAVSLDDIHFGKDQEIYDLLLRQKDPFIQEQMYKISHYQEFFHICGPLEIGDLKIKNKFRGINPMIKLENQIARLTELDQEARKNYEETKELIASGWQIKLIENQPTPIFS